MSATRKLSQFRQLSLNCESPSPQQKRKTLKKQFSEDLPDFNNSWLEQGHEIRISLNSKNKKNDKNTSNRPPSIKIAWGDKSEIKDSNFGINEESVIIKQFKEIKRVPSSRLTRHASLEKDSILNSKQDFADRLRLKNPNIEKENEKSENKHNLQIFLAHSTQDFNEDLQTNISDSQTLLISDQFVDNTQPKFLQPLLTNVGQDKAFHIRKSGNKKTLDSPKFVDVSQKRPNFSRSNTIVVVPIIEKNKDDRNNMSSSLAPPIKDLDTKLPNNEDVNGINVIIRPVTAQSRREKFQKTNSAFHGASKEQPLNFRPPLVRSSSAPSTKPEKSKFLATKRKLKTFKKIHNSPKDEDRSYKHDDAKEWNNAAQTTPEVVTMVSLLSPSGSDNEDCSEDEAKERPKSVLKRESSIVEKNLNSVKEEENNKEMVKNVSLRKTVKSVSFQQSSIHAIRSFSASFPARRGSMATALALGSNNNTGQTKNTSTISKTQEKRGTNPSSPDANERVPKRRLVRSNTEETKSSLLQHGLSHTKHPNKTEKTELDSPITIDIHTKPRNHETEDKFLETSLKLNLEENVILIIPEVKKEDKTSSEEETKVNDQPSHDTPKEKQCWAMFCKMTEKGINVSYDTILRGMLTPTEYRMRRKTSIAEEMNMLVNPPSTESTVENTESLKAKPTIE